MFEAVSLTKHPDIGEYKYFGYGIGFDRRETFSIDSGFGRNCIIFGVDRNYSVHVDNKKKDIAIIGEGTTQGLYCTTMTAEKDYSINFTENSKKFCLSLHYNGANSYSFVNTTEIIKFKAKDPEINPIPLCLGNISKDFSVDDMKKIGFVEALN